MAKSPLPTLLQLDASPTNNDLISVILIFDQGYWAVGANGTILSYPFYGPYHDTWQILPSPTTATLNGIGAGFNFRMAVGGGGAAGMGGVILEDSTGVWRTAPCPDPRMASRRESLLRVVLHD